MDNNDVRINPAGEGLAIARLGAGAVGAVSTFVSLWSGGSQSAGPQPVTDWLTRVDNANAGSTFKITRRGIYGVSAMITIVAGPVDVAVGAMLDAGNVAPDMSSPVGFSYAAATLATEGPVVLSAVGSVAISQALAKNPTTGIITVNLSTMGGAAVTAANIDLNLSNLRIVRVGDVNSVA